MGSFDIKGGHGGVTMGCIHCGQGLVRDTQTGNYKCVTPGCGKGSLSSPDGVETTVDEHGNVTLTSGKKPS